MKDQGNLPGGKYALLGGVSGLQKCFVQGGVCLDPQSQAVECSIGGDIGRIGLGQFALAVGTDVVIFEHVICFCRFSKLRKKSFSSKDSSRDLPFYLLVPHFISSAFIAAHGSS